MNIIIKQLHLLMWLGIITLLAGCTLPRFQPIQEPRQIPQITPQYFIASDGAHMPVRYFLPKKQKKPRALIIALHGFNDYSNAFAMPGKYFAENGLGLIAYDQRGFGRTANRGIWGGQQNLERDLAQMVVSVRKLYPDVPIYVLGESMGAAVVVAAMTEPGFPSAAVKGVILLSPAVWGENTLNPFYRFVLWFSAHHFPQITLTGKGLKILASDNIEMLKALGRDPLVIKQTRIDAIYGLVQLMDKAQHNIPQLDKPLLFLYGRHDQVIPPVAIVGALKNMRQKFTMAYYPNGWHMLLRDLQSKCVQDDIIAWIADRDKTLPSGAMIEPSGFRGKKH